MLRRARVVHYLHLLAASHRRAPSDSGPASSDHSAGSGCASPCGPLARPGSRPAPRPASAADAGLWHSPVAAEARIVMNPGNHALSSRLLMASHRCSRGERNTFRAPRGKRMSLRREQGSEPTSRPRSAPTSVRAVRFCRRIDAAGDARSSDPRQIEPRAPARCRSGTDLTRRRPW